MGKPIFRRIELPKEEGQFETDENKLPPLPKPKKKKEPRYTAPVVGEDDDDEEEEPQPQPKGQTSDISPQEVDDMIEGHLVRLYELIKYRRQI